VIPLLTKLVVKHFCQMCDPILISACDNNPDRNGIPLGGLERALHNSPDNKTRGPGTT
jgi:hypothetical protein